MLAQPVSIAVIEMMSMGRFMGPSEAIGAIVNTTASLTVRTYFILTTDCGDGSVTGIGIVTSM